MVSFVCFNDRSILALDAKVYSKGYDEKYSRGNARICEPRSRVEMV